jgi:hypothetical protein
VCGSLERADYSGNASNPFKAALDLSGIDGKPLTIGLWCHAHGAQKAAAQGFLAAEPALHGDPFDRHAGVAEQPPRGLDADQFDGPGRGLAGVGAVVAHETALAHAGLLGQGRNAEVAGEVFGDPGVKLVEPVAFFLQDRVTLNCD